MNCGESRLVRPSMGSWLTYGLGTENQNLPGFIAMCPRRLSDRRDAELAGGVSARHLSGNVRQHAAHRDRQAGRERPQPVAAAPTPSGGSSTLLAALNQRHQRAARRRPGPRRPHPQSFELAYRMQREAAEAFDVSREPKHVLDSLRRRHAGPADPDRPPADRARRAVRAGLARPGPAVGQPRRHRGQPPQAGRPVRPGDRRAASPISSGCGLFEETLILWGGEFGRTPTVELPQAGANAGKINGRDHNHWGFTVLAGRRRREGRPDLRRDRRVRLQGRRKPRPRPRPARHDAAAAGLRPRAAHLPLRRPRLPPDRRAWQGGRAS